MKQLQIISLNRERFVAPIVVTGKFTRGVAKELKMLPAAKRVFGMSAAFCSVTVKIKGLPH